MLNYQRVVRSNLIKFVITDDNLSILKYLTYLFVA